MSTSYTPTSNWTDRDLKGRDLRAKPVRPAEPVSFSSDPATDRLSRRMAADVRPQCEVEAPIIPSADDHDDFMNRPMVNSSGADAVIERKGIGGVAALSAPLPKCLLEKGAERDVTKRLLAADSLLFANH